MSEGQAVLVTGAAGGIGTAITKALVQKGYRVYAGVRDPSRAVSGAEMVTLDVTDAGRVHAAAKEVAARQDGRGLRAVVNNAGIIVQGPLELVPAAELERQFAVNVFGAAEVTRAFLPLLRKGSGRLVNISAPSARVAVPYAGPISASKAALESLSDAARVELAPWGIAVVVVVPGAVRTEIFAKADAAAQQSLQAIDPGLVSLYQRQLEAVAATQRRMRMAPPEPVAEAAVRAVEASRPKTRYLAGADVRAVSLISRLPVRTRDRALRRALGLHKIRSTVDGGAPRTRSGG